MFAIDAAQQHHLQVGQQIQQEQVTQAKQEGSNVIVEQEEDEVGNNSISESVSSPPSVRGIHNSEEREPQIPGTDVPVSTDDSVAIATDHAGGSRRSTQQLFVNSDGQTQIPSLLLNVQQNHYHPLIPNSCATSTPVVSPLASPIASPQPSHQLTQLTASTNSTSSSCFSSAPLNTLPWPTTSLVLPPPLSNNQHQQASETPVLSNQQLGVFWPQHQVHPFPALHHSPQNLQQQHPIPQVLPQHPLQPSFSNPRTDPTVPPGCQEHGFNLIGQKYLLHDQIEGSHLQRCIEVDTQQEYVCKVSLIILHQFP